MSNLCIIPASAIADTRLEHRDIRVLCAIGKFTDGGGEGAWASARTLSEAAGISRSYFFVSARRLLELGYIRRAIRQGRTSVYAVVLQSKTVGQLRRNPSRHTRTGSAKGLDPNATTRPNIAGRDPSKHAWTRTSPGTFPLTPTEVSGAGGGLGAGAPTPTPQASRIDTQPTLLAETLKAVAAVGGDLPPAENPQDFAPRTTGRRVPAPEGKAPEYLAVTAEPSPVDWRAMLEEAAGPRRTYMLPPNATATTTESIALGPEAVVTPEPTLAGAVT